MRNNPYFIEDVYAAMGVKFSPEYLDKLRYREYILGYPAFRPEQGELERNEILSREGMKFLRTNPGFFLKLCWIRFQWTIGWRGIGLGPLQNFISLISYGPILLGFTASLIWGWGRLAAVLPLWGLVGSRSIGPIRSEIQSERRPRSRRTWSSKHTVPKYRKTLSSAGGP